RPFKLGSGLMTIRHRHAPNSDETIRLARDVFGDAVIDDTSRLDSDVERHGVITLRRWRHDNLNVDAHVVEVTQSFSEPLVAPGDPAGPVDLLLCVDLLRVSRRKKGKRDGGNVKMRCNDGRGGGHCDVRMNVDRRAARSRLAAGTAVLACRGRTIGGDRTHSY